MLDLKGGFLDGVFRLGLYAGFKGWVCSRGLKVGSISLVCGLALYPGYVGWVCRLGV